VERQSLGRSFRVMSLSTGLESMFRNGMTTVVTLVSTTAVMPPFV
jgi:hypothetical protein